MMAAKKRKKSAKEKEEDINKELITGREKQRKEQNRILRNILIMVAVFVAVIFLIVLISRSSSKFEYRGIKFEKTRFCDAGPPCLVLYRTSLPVKMINNNTAIIVSPEKKDTDYNFYFRNDPRKLDVPFNGTVRFGSIMVLNSKDAFHCDGYGAIAAANFNQLFQVLRTKVIKDENATCDPYERYIFIVVKPGNETRIEEYSRSCYNIYIKDCEILEGTEKFMIETLVKVNESLRKAENSTNNTSKS